MKHSKKQINNIFNEVKCSQFKMWKSGKNWFYGGVTLLIAFGAILVATNIDINQQVVYADPITQGHPNQEEQIPFVGNDIPALSKIDTRAEVSAEYGVVKWTKDTKLEPLTQQAVIPISDIDPTWISWLGSNHKVYEMRKGDSFLISNVTKDENGNLVSAIATVEDIGPYANPASSIDKAHNRYAIIIENGEITTATAKDGKTITSDHPIHLFYSGVSAPKLKYKFVKASDNKTPVTITAQTTFFDIDAAQGMKTDLFPKEQEQMFLPTTKEGRKTLTFNASKQTLVADYSGNVENIGDGSGFVGPTGTKLDNYGAGYGQAKSNWVGKEFTMEFAANAYYIDSSLSGASIPIDKLIGINQTYKKFADGDGGAPVRGTYRHELFGKTTTNMFPPQSPVEPDAPQNPSLPNVPTVPTKPVLPKAPSTPQLESIQTAPVPPKAGVTPKVPSVPTLSPISDAPEAPNKPTLPKAPVAPKTPELPGVPSAPKLDNYETEVPKLPTPPTLSEVKNDLAPTKGITDEAGNDVNGQSLATDKKFDYTITQTIEGKGKEFSNFNTFKENVAKWKADCEKIIAAYQAEVKANQGKWDEDNQKVQTYIKDYQNYSEQYDKVVEAYDEAYGEYKTSFENYAKTFNMLVSHYNTAWDKYAADFAAYVTQYDKHSEEYNTAWLKYLENYKTYSEAYDKVVTTYNQEWGGYLKDYQVYSKDYDTKVGNYTEAWNNYVKDYQSYSEDFDKKVSDYNTAWNQYSLNFDAYSEEYDAAVTQFNTAWSQYETKYEKYKELWSSYDAAYKGYASVGGKEPEIPLVPKKDKPSWKAKAEKSEKEKLETKTSQGTKADIPAKVAQSTQAAFDKKGSLSPKEEIPTKQTMKKKETLPHIEKMEEASQFEKKVPKEDIVMPERPIAVELKLPTVPSIDIKDYLFTKAEIKDSIDLSKVVLPEGTSSMKVLDKAGQEIKATITREDKDGKANIFAALDSSYVQSDAFYNNSFSLIIGGVMFNIDDQPKSEEEMKASNIATSNVPKPTPDPETPSTDDPKNTNEVDVDPEYSEPSIVKEQSLDGKEWTTDPLELSEHDQTWQERITHQLSNHADYETITLKDDWETVKRFETMHVTNFEGKEVEGTTEYLNADGKDVSQALREGALQKDGKQEQVTILFHVKDPSQFTRAQEEKLKLYMTFTGVTAKGASGQEEVNYLEKDDTIQMPDTAHTEWTDKTPEDGDKGKGTQTSNTVIEVLPKLEANFKKFVVTKKEGENETPLDVKGEYKPDYLKAAILTEGEALVAQKDIVKGEEVTWAIVGTPGNQGLLSQVVDTLPDQLSFSSNIEGAFRTFVLKNDGTLGDDISKHFEYKIDGNVATVTPKSATDFFFVGSSTDSRYVIMVKTRASEDIKEGATFVNHANQTVINPKNPEELKDNKSEAQVSTPQETPQPPQKQTPKRKSYLPSTGVASDAWLGGLGLILLGGTGIGLTQKKKTTVNKK